MNELLLRLAKAHKALLGHKTSSLLIEVEELLGVDLSAPSTETRMVFLSNTLRRYNHHYYCEDMPTVTDAEYDALFDELVKLEGDKPSLDSPTQNVGCQICKKEELEQLAEGATKEKG